MNRANPGISILRAFFIFTLLSSLHVIAWGQSNAQFRRPTVSRSAVLQAIHSSGHKYRANLTQIPPDVTRRTWKTTRSGKGITRAPGDSGVVRQTILITPQNPATPGSTTPSPAQENHPFWTPDEQFIFFDSNRTGISTATDPGGTSPVDPTNPTAGPYNIFRELSDGSGVVQITTGTDNKLDPAVSQDGSLMAYVAGGTLNFDLNPNSPTYLNSTSSGFNLYTVNLNNGGTPLPLTINATGFQFSDVRHPSWLPGGTLIAFAGQLTGAPNYHIFVVDTNLGKIQQLTAGGSNDYSPAWSPDGNLIAFTTNGTGFSNSFPSTASGKNGYDNIWVLQQPAVGRANPKQVTGLPGATSSNKNPAWSALRSDPSGTINNNGAPRLMLAFASNRTSGSAGTFEIYFLNAAIGPDPVNRQGGYTVTTPESTGNPGLLLQTSTPSEGIDPTDPNNNFTQNHKWSEDYPAWPQYINTYRMVFQSNKGGNLNLWASTIIDLNSPTLLKYDATNNQIVGIYQNQATILPGSTNYVRQVTPGTPLRFRVRVADYETGVKDVYLQIKNPTSKPQSQDGHEHKVYAQQFSGLENFTVPGGLDGFIVQNPPYEEDAQAIHPNFYTFQQPGYASAAFRALFGPIPATWPGTNKYIAGISDDAAFSGAANAPDADYWLPLYDDGPVSQGGHEPEGEVAGDGVFTTVWNAPSIASDWYMDVIARDNAVDPFDPTQQINWKIYDNVWGFTTQQFQHKGQILYVNDYDSGQRFFTFHSQNFLLTVSDTPTESWMTEYDSALFPKVLLPASGGGTASQFFHNETTLGMHSYGTFLRYYDPLDDDGLRNSDSDESGTTFNPFPNIGAINPVTGRYDQWRILSRGPLPDAILNLYAPHTVSQPADPISKTPARTVVVAPQAVIWHSPYSGDLFVGSGTIVDVNTQAQLQRFVQGGGRLFVNGQDIAWALSLGDPNSSAANSFLTNVLHVSFFQDFEVDTVYSQLNTTGTTPGKNPIAEETWYQQSGALLYHPDFVPNGPTPPNPPWLPPGNVAINVGTKPGTGPGGPFYDWDAGNQYDPDVVKWNPPASVTSGVDYTYSKANQPGVMYYFDPATNSRVVFSPLGFESISPETTGVATNVVANRNLRTELVHNILDYLRTGRIYGQLLQINGGKTQGGIANVLVRAIDANTGLLAGTAYTQNDGTYSIDGLYPSGAYTIDASKPGFLAEHLQFTYFHGAYQSRLDIYLQPAPPGTISGKVTRQDGSPVPGAIVVAIDPTNPNATNPPSATTGADGTYTITNVPASSTIGYIVRITNLAALKAAGSIPPSYGGPEQGASPAVTLTGGQQVTGINFQLTPLPGVITGTVTDAKTNAPIAGATIIATLNSNSTITFTTTTAANGTYTLNNVIPGTYTVVAQAIGYAPGQNTSVVVTSQGTIAINFQLTQIPPGNLIGRVETSYGFAVAGATITGTGPTGIQIATTTTGGETNPPGGNNYFIANVPAGATVSVTAQKTGYNNNQPTAAVTVLVVSKGANGSGPDTQVPTLTLDPLHVFSTTLSLVSSPYEYKTPLATLLGVQNDVGGALQFFAWNTVAYVAYPTPPADTLHRGDGYFLADSNTAATLALTTIENPTDTTTPFNIQLKPGWNLIGDPFPFPIDFLGLKVLDANNAPSDIVTAQGTGKLGAALWAYDNGAYHVAYTLDQWKGYWIKAYQPLTLVVDPAAALPRSAPLKHNSRAVLDISNSQGDGWKLDLVATAAQTRAAGSFIGVRRDATEGYDRFKLEAPPTMGKQSVAVTFNHTDWGAKSGKYAVDVRSASLPTHSWTFTVTSNVPNTPVTLQWPTIATVSGKDDLILTDLATNAKVNLRNQLSYTILASGSAVSRNFLLQTQRATRQNLQILGVTARTNSGGASRAPVSVGISYTLTSDATVQVSIQQNGRRIRTLDSGQTRAVGANDLLWDMKDDQNRTVPSNTYTLEVRAVDKNGHVVRQTVPLLIPR